MLVLICSQGLERAALNLQILTRPGARPRLARRLKCMGFVTAFSCARNPFLNLWGVKTQSWLLCSYNSQWKDPKVKQLSPKNGPTHTPRCLNTSQAVTVVVEVIANQAFKSSAN